MGWAALKVMSIAMFLGAMVLAFIWMAAAASDLAVFFGFRTSHTVANDIANRITSVSSVPGEAAVKYPIYAGSNSQNRAEYDILIGSGIVCVTSRLGASETETTDCASHQYEIGDGGYSKSKISEGCFTFKKLPSSLENKRPKLEVDFDKDVCEGIVSAV